MGAAIRRLASRGYCRACAAPGADCVETDRSARTACANAPRPALPPHSGGRQNDPTTGRATLRTRPDYWEASWTNGCPLVLRHHRVVQPRRDQHFARVLSCRRQDVELLLQPLLEHLRGHALVTRAFL